MIDPNCTGFYNFVAQHSRTVFSRDRDSDWLSVSREFILGPESGGSSGEVVMNVGWGWKASPKKWSIFTLRWTCL